MPVSNPVRRLFQRIGAARGAQRAAALWFLMALPLATPVLALPQLVCVAPTVQTEHGTTREPRICWFEDDGRSTSAGEQGNFAGVGGGGGGGQGNAGNATEVRDAAEKDCGERAGNPAVHVNLVVACDHAAIFAAMDSRSGLRATRRMGVQLRVWDRQRLVLVRSTSLHSSTTVY
jgi:hypothetical protein